MNKLKSDKTTPTYSYRQLDWTSMKNEQPDFDGLNNIDICQCYFLLKIICKKIYYSEI